MASFLSALFIITHANHKCTDESCRICCQLENAKNTLKQLSMSKANNTLFLPVLTLLILSVINCFYNRETVSLVALKIRMDN